MENMVALVTAYAPIIGMVLVFYFMIYRPQKNERQKRNDMLSSLHKGNKVITVGGIYGEIINIKDNVIDLKIADKVVIQVTRSSVGKNVSQDKEAPLFDELTAHEDQ